MNSTVKTNIATINKPNKFVNTWSFDFYAGGNTSQFVGGFATHKEAVAGLRTEHADAELLSNKDYHREVAYGHRITRSTNDAYYSRAIEG